MRGLGVKGVHIAERDTQAGPRRQADRQPSSTPGRWRGSSRRASSRPSSAGAATSAGSRRTATATPTGCKAAIYLDTPGLADQGPYLDAGGGAAVRLSRHPQRGDLDRGLLHHRRGRRAGVPADLPLRLPPLRPGGAEPARDAGLGPGAGGQKILDENEILWGEDDLGRAALRPRAGTRSGTARGCRSRRRGRWRRSRTRPGCR